MPKELLDEPWESAGDGVHGDSSRNVTQQWGTAEPTHIANHGKSPGAS
ncbi:MAG: hypothetical protein LKI88_06715 [Bifidobacterium sp.]|nr:hypothetical protein [Bifidobacterium sp.]